MNNQEPTNALQFWVSPTGDDKQPGTHDAPFKTLAHSWSTAIAQLEAGIEKDIVIWLLDGTHRLTEPLRLESSKQMQMTNKISFKADPGHNPKWCGSKQLTKWKPWKPTKGFDPNVYENIYVAKIGSHRSRQLYVNGQRMPRARTTMNPDGFLPYDGKFVNEKWSIDPKRNSGIYFTPSPYNPPAWRDPAKWSNISQVEAVTYSQWRMLSVPVESIESDKSGNYLKMKDPAWTNANLYRKYASTWNPEYATVDSWRVTYFENSLSFLTDPGEWFLDDDKDLLYYKPLPGQDMTQGHLKIELPILEYLVIGLGSELFPLKNLYFEGITFEYATWNAPSNSDGYISDQAGFLVTGSNNKPSNSNHQKVVSPTPGNLTFEYAQNVTFVNNTFQHLGGVALSFPMAGQGNKILFNTFRDLSSTAIQLGGVSKEDGEQTDIFKQTIGNTISQNTIENTGVEYIDTAAIFIGFASFTEVSYNMIRKVPWAGITIGWGWTMKGFPGYSPSKNPMSNNRLISNTIEEFLQVAWDGGAIYLCGLQGPNLNEGLMIKGNWAAHKRPGAGGIVFYTDQGSQNVSLIGNFSYNNPVGYIDIGPEFDTDKLLKWPAWAQSTLEYDNQQIAAMSKIPYGFTVGGTPTGKLKIAYNQGIESQSFWLGVLDVLAGDFGKILPEDIEFVNNAPQVSFGQVNYPPQVNNGANVKVPGISLPDVLGLQNNFEKEQWQLGGTLLQELGAPISFSITISREAFRGFQIVGGTLAITLDEEGAWRSFSAETKGLGSSQFGPNGAFQSLVVEPINNQHFCIRYKPDARVTGLFHDKPIPELEIGENPCWQFQFVDGPGVGQRDAQYSLTINTLASVVQNDSSKKTPLQTVSLELNMTDPMGVVIENEGAVVGNAYHVNIPELSVTSCSLKINQVPISVYGGVACLSRQMTASPENAPPPPYAMPFPNKSSGSISFAEYFDKISPLKLIKPDVAKNSFIGTRMVINLVDGPSFVLVEAWKRHIDQWISGTMINPGPLSLFNPLPESYGNLYVTDNRNECQVLRPRLYFGQANENWDFDINIQSPADLGIFSPHWSSARSGNTYATAWQVDFSPLVQALGLPASLSIEVLSDGAEVFVPYNPLNSYYSGAATVKVDGILLGYAFVEQIGYGFLNEI